MISVGQLANALYGVWLLLKLDARALDYFEKTPGGFARSFVIAILLEPLRFAHVVIVYDPEHSKLALVPYLVVQLLSDVLTWVGFPFVMLYVAQMLGRTPRYLTYIVPYNWFQLPVGLAILPISLLADFNIVSGDVAAFVNFIALLLYFTYGVFIARIGLLVGLLTAIGIVVLDLLLTLLTNQVIARI